MGTLSAGLEDYIELIYNLTNNSGPVKAIDISKKMNISRASVSEALTKLVNKNLIKYNEHKEILITNSGQEIAKYVIERHNTLEDFFKNTLGLKKYLAEKNACRIEHVVDDEVFERLKEFQNFCNDNSFIKEFKEKYKEEQ